MLPLTERSMHFWRDRRTFVTGATGLLGGHLVHLLIAAGARIVTLLRDEVPEALFYELQLDRRATIVRGGLEDYLLLERCLNEYEIDTIFHLGAQTLVGVAQRGPLSTFESNIRGTWHLLEAARRSGRVTRFILASSDKAYGDQPVLPYDEQTPLQGRHPYDVSKTCADLIASSYFHSFRLPVCITRCGNLFGPGDLNDSRIIPGTIRSVLRGEPPIIRSDGTPIRDYLYVEDAARACLLLAEELDRPDLPGEAFNFSLEQPMSVLEVVERLLVLMGRPDVRPTIRGEALLEIQAQYLSARKARERLGWFPRFELEQGLRETIAWYQRRLSSP